MTRLARWIAILRIVLHLVLGMLIVLLRFNHLSTEVKDGVVRRWSISLLRLMGIRVQYKGLHVEDTRVGGTMLVLNHVSWIDIYLVNSHRATSFVAKAEIRAWPLLGWLCARTGTIFLQRERRRGLQKAIEESCEVLRRGGAVGVFPESTTTDGSGLLPFHSNLLQGASIAAVDVVPVALRYMDINGERSMAPAYIGDMTLWQSLNATLSAAPIFAELTFLPQIDFRLGRRKIAQLAHGAIVASLEHLGPSQNQES